MLEAFSTSVVCELQRDENPVLNKSEKDRDLIGK